MNPNGNQIPYNGGHSGHPTTQYMSEEEYRRNAELIAIAQQQNERIRQQSSYLEHISGMTEESLQQKVLEGQMARYA
jgi:hypothetical protein